MIYELTYIRTGRVNETDTVILRTGEKIEFEDSVEIPTNITEIIEVFEMIAAKWWGTYENRNAITNIRTLSR